MCLVMCYELVALHEGPASWGTTAQGPCAYLVPSVGPIGPQQNDFTHVFRIYCITGGARTPGATASWHLGFTNVVRDLVTIISYIYTHTTAHDIRRSAIQSLLRDLGPEAAYFIYLASDNS